jgi:hypothetical protein
MKVQAKMKMKKPTRLSVFNIDADPPKLVYEKVIDRAVYKDRLHMSSLIGFEAKRGHGVQVEPIK